MSYEAGGKRRERNTEMKKRREEILNGSFRRGQFDLYQITCGSRIALTCKNV